MTVLFVEHDMDMVRDISDWVIVMAQGKVVAEGPADSVMADPASSTPTSAPTTTSPSSTRASSPRSNRRPPRSSPPSKPAPGTQEEDR